MASAAPATQIAPTAADAASRSAAKTPAARPLIGHLCSVKECISLKDLTETWQAQSAYLQEAQAAGQLKHIGARPPIRGHVLNGMCVLQRLLGQSNTAQRLQADGRPDTEGGLVSVPIPAPPSRWHFPGAREGACTEGATTLQPWIVRLIRNAGL
jgi:hypothetical protein